MVTSSTCADYDEYITDAPDSIIQPGDNLVAVRAVDRGGDSFVDISIVIDYEIQPGLNTYISSGPDEGLHLNVGSTYFSWYGTDDLTPAESLLYSYKMDDLSWSPFASDTNHTFLYLSEGNHTFQVKAQDADLNEDVTPANRSFVVDLTPPVSTLESGPNDGDTLLIPTATFCVSGNDNLSDASEIEFAFKLDSDPFSDFASRSCTTFTDLSSGYHTFYCIARDKAGNVEETPLSILFRIESVDLRPTAITVPDSVYASIYFDVSWSVTNYGHGLATGGWTDKVYLSNDSLIGSDTLIGEFVFVDSLGYSESRLITERISIPAFSEGDYWIIIEIDANDDIYEEAGENNNLIVAEHVTNLELPTYISGGVYNYNVTWSSTNSPYVILGDVTVALYPGGVTLTIQPGVEVYFADNAGLRIGGYGWHNPSYQYEKGQLYAVGTSDSPIIFSSLSGNSKGWDGIHFWNGSGLSGAVSTMKYCVVEKAGQGGWGVITNIYCQSSSNQPTLKNCIIKDGYGDGLYLSGAAPSVDTTEFSSNSRGVVCSGSSPVIRGCRFYNNTSYGLQLSGNSYPYLANNIYELNGYGKAIAEGGRSSSGTWHNDGEEPYVVLGKVTISKYPEGATLTIRPGVELQFSDNAGIQIGGYSWHGSTYGYDKGQLNAIGTPDSQIVFTSLSGMSDGWDGLYFQQGSSIDGAISMLKYCTIEKGGQVGWDTIQANINCYGTGQPSINQCEIRDADGHGIYLYGASINIDSASLINNTTGVYCSGSSPHIHNSSFNNNTNYGIYLSGNSFPNLYSNLYSYLPGSYGKAMAGGGRSSSGSWYNDGDEPYVVLGKIYIEKYPGGATLTIQSGVKINFANNAGIQIGGYSWHGSSYGYNKGQLNAIGTPDSQIVFTSLSGVSDGWDGLYFQPGSSIEDAISTLKHCIIEKGGQVGWDTIQANINCIGTGQPSINQCEIRDADGYGIYLNGASINIDSTSLIDNTTGAYCNGSSPHIHNSSFTNNDNHGIYLSGNSQAIIGDSNIYTCNIYGNGLYDVYNNTSNNINARYNFWGTGYISEISEQIYDYDDNSSRGHIYFIPFITILDTYIRSGPSEYEHINIDSAYFSWAGTDDNTPIESLLYSYKMDEDDWSAFADDTSHSFLGLSEGNHTFQVKVRDGDLNEDSIPAYRNFIVDLTPPETYFASGPQDSSAITVPYCTFCVYGSDNITDSSNILFSFKIDDDPYSGFSSNSCSTFTGLVEGSHNFYCVAKDIAGNEDSSPLTIEFDVGYVDLQPISIAAAFEAQCNRSTVISWTTINNGAGIIESSWKDEIYLSPDSAVGDDIYLGEVTISDSLGFEDSYSVADTVLLPDGLTGEYWIIIKIDADNNIHEENNENNNTIIADHSTSLTLPSHPDLYVSNIVVPENGSAGQTINIQWTVINQGDTAAESDWTEYIYLSTDNVSGLDILVSSYEYIDGLVMAQDYSHIHSIAVPEDTIQEYWVIVKTDALNQVNEYELDSNNVRISDSSFAVKFGDLQPTEIATPDSGLCNRKIEVSWTAVNYGDGLAAGGWIDKVYLSSDSSIGNDTYLGEFSISDSLFIEDSYQYTDSILLPDSLVGDYWIIVKIDADNNIFEHTNEGNNFIISSHPTHLSFPPHANLQVVDITVPDDGWTGQAIDVSWTVVNNGNAPTENSWIEYVYLSTDNTIGSDIYITSFTYTEGLDSDESYTHIHPVQIPIDAPDEYWVVVKTDATNKVNEYESENNNIRISDSSVIAYQSPFPDLIVSSVAVPDSTTSGQTIDVSWVVTNNGTGATDAPVWYDKVYLSVDSIYNSGDTQLGSFQNFSYLAAGQSYQQTKTVTLPWELSGPYYIIIKTDATNLVNEHNSEGNNISHSNVITIEYTAEPMPYLTTTILQCPSTVWSSQPITVTWEVMNTGNAVAHSTYTGFAQWNDAIFFSQDAFYDQSDLMLELHPGWHPGDLEPGEADTLTYTVTPPAASGVYYILIIPDAHRWIPGGFSIGVAEINFMAIPPVDLEVTDVAIAVDSIKSGSLMEIQWTVTNEAVDSTGHKSWTDGVYLSDDTIFNSGIDILMITRTFTGNLVGLDAYSKTDTITIPNNLYGEYFIIVYTDMNNNIGEDMYENNNSSPSSAFEIIFTPPDLQVTNITTPDSVFSGQSTNIEWTASNFGPGRTAPILWHDKAYLSNDNILEISSDLLLYDYTHSGALDSAEYYSKNTSVSIPNGYSGVYYLFVVTDANGQVFEDTLENNNISIDSFPIILTPPPDLKVTELATLDSALAGFPLNVQWTVENSGLGSTGSVSWKDKIYISTNSNSVITGDILLQTVSHSGPLAIGAAYSNSRDITIPSGYAGVYYLKTMTDAENVVYEHSNENNNVTVKAIQISAPDWDDLHVPNLAVTAFAAPDTIVAGTALSVDWTVANTRQFPTPASVGYWYDAIYLSTDNILDTEVDQKLAQYTHFGVLADSSSYIKSNNITCPDGLSGQYYIIIKVDNSNLLTETDETDNSMEFMTAIELLPPDLIVTNITSPDSADAGQSINVAWTVLNDGEGDTKVSSWYDGIYLSKDQILDATDHNLGYLQHNQTLLKDSTYIANKDVTIPSGASGPYYVIIKTDKNNDVDEFDYENNNYTRTQDAIEIILPEPVNLLVTDITIPDSAIAGKEVSFSWTVTNDGENDVTGSWTDAVYISPDTIWDYYDPVIGTTVQLSGLKAGQSYSKTLSVRIEDFFGNLDGDLPGVTPGDYRIIVRTDLRNNINETNENDNTARSLDSLSVDVTVLTLDVPYEDSLSSGEERYYQVEVPEGEDLRISLDYNDPDALIELYVKYGEIPDRIDYDYSYIMDQSSDSITIIIPNSIMGTYYIGIKLNGVLNNSIIYSIITEILPFKISNISPNRIGNFGEATIEISGSRFGFTYPNICPNVYIYSDSLLINAKQLYHVNSTKIYATFDLTNVPIDTYNLVVQHEIMGIPDSLMPAINIKENDTAFQAIEVISDSLLGFHLTIIAPPAIRNDQIATANITYSNIGINDLPVPLILIEIINGTLLQVETYELPQNGPILLQAYSNKGPKGILPIGGSGEFDIRYIPDPWQNALVRATILPSDETNINYEQIAGILLPESLDEDWDSRWNEFTNIMGPSLNTWTDALSEKSNTNWLLNDNKILATETLASILISISTSSIQINKINNYNINNAPLNSSFMPTSLRIIRDELLEKIWNYNGESTSLELTESEIEQLRDLMYSRANWLSAVAPSAAALIRKSLDGNYDDIGSDDELGIALENKVYSNLWSQWSLISDIRSHIYNHYNEYGEINTLIYNPLNNCRHDFNSFPTYQLPFGYLDLFGGLGSVSWNINFNMPYTNVLNEPYIKETWYKVGIQMATVNEKYDFHYKGKYWPGFDAECNQIMFILTTHDGIPENLKAATFDISLNVDFEVTGTVFKDPLQMDNLYNELYEEFIFDISTNGYLEEWETIAVGGLDPNEKMGPTAPEEENLITTEQTLPYTIYFENMPDATAPAVGVIITDQLDENLDWRKFALGEISFGDTTIIVPENRSYWHTTVNLDSLGLLLEIDAGINAWTGEAHWYFETIDPNTGQPPTDPFAGFLPPNDSTRRGEGHVTFNIMADDDLPEGTEIYNSATIVFDVNDPIITNQVVNVIYNSKPDLVITSSGVQSGSSTLITDEPATLYTVVENQGQSGCDAFYVKMFLGNPEEDGILIDSSLVSGMGKGQVNEISFLWLPTERLDSGYIYYYADFDNDIMEMDESNNVHTHAISIITEYLCADADNSGAVNILDITYLINYLYRGGPAPVPIEEAGDADGSGAINILDIVYTINYLYKGGPEPICEGESRPFASSRLPTRNMDGIIKCTVRNGRSFIEVNSPTEIYGLEIMLRSMDSSFCEIYNLVSGIGLFSNQASAEIKLGMLDVQGKYFIPKGEIAILDVAGEVEILNALGSDEWANPVFFKISNSLLPRDFTLSQNYPNPFNPLTIINFALPQPSVPI